jgi:photosystem II stability/assembly factor-like uncharacterized protein
MAERNANLQWRPTPATSPPAGRTDDIWFVDPENGWAVNSSGKIRKTTDGGASWTTQLQVVNEGGSNVWLRCMGFATPERGWVGTVGTPVDTVTNRRRRLYATTDGGENWCDIDARLPANAPSAICGLSVVDEQVVYASGTNYPDRPAAMVKTTDGGETWTGLDMLDDTGSKHASLLVDTYFTTPERGWVVGGKTDIPPSGILCPLRKDVKPVVLFTEDGGTTWENQVANLTFPLGEWGWKIQFLNDQVGFVALENCTEGAILTTTDGGLIWQRHVVNDSQPPQGQSNANLEGIGFENAQHGWVGGWGTADFQGGYSSETFDGGETWQAANHVGLFLNRFRFFGDPVTVGYAAGDTVYKYSAEPVVPAVAEAALAGPQILDEATPVEINRPIEIGFTTPPGARRLTIDVWDRFGEPVRQLVDETDPASGHRSVTWDFTSGDGAPLPDGSYIYRVTIDGEAESRIVQLKRDS